jgi:carbonic anhydrase
MTDISCEALVVHCMDYRLQKSLNDWLDKNPGAGNYDRVAIAGGVLDIYSVLKQIELAVRVHRIRKVILVNHEDCRAYGPAGTFERHQVDLTEAEHKIHALHMNLIVEKYYLKLDGAFDRVY